MTTTINMPDEAAEACEKLFESLHEQGVTLLGLVVGFPVGGKITKCGLVFSPELDTESKDAILGAILSGFNETVQ